MRKILEPIIYLFVWFYFYIPLFFKAIVKYLSSILRAKVKLNIHTFIGIGLAVFYYYVLTGRIEEFHGFHDSLPLLEGSIHYGRGPGMAFGIAIASVLLIIFSEGILVFIGYTLIFWAYVIFSAFETPKRIESNVKEHLSFVVVPQKRKMKGVISYRRFGRAERGYHNLNTMTIYLLHG